MSSYLEAVETWKRQRGELCHNRIKNHFLPGLATALNVLNGEVEDAAFEESFRRRLLPEWRDLGSEIERLTKRFPEVAAPSVFLATLPGVQSRPEDYSWVAEVSDCLWKNRHGTEAFCAEILEMKKRADTIHQRLEVLVESALSRETGVDGEVGNAIIELHDCCEELAGALAALDRKFSLV